MNVFFWTASDDGSSWYRANNPAMALQWSGHSARVSTRISMQDVESADVIVVSRPAQPASIESIRRIKAMGKPVFADMDDDYFSIDPASNPVAAKFWTHKMLVGLQSGLAMCDGVICASKRLAMALAERLPSSAKVYVIENGLHAGMLSLPHQYEKDEIVLGWAGSGNTAAWVPSMARAVNLALKTHEHVKFMSVGVPRPVLHQRLGIENVPGRVGVVPWAKHGNDYLKMVGNFDIWLAPYADIPFNRAKFPTKALEAGFFGTPLVVSDIAPYTDWDRAETPGMLFVKRDHEWSRHIARLIADARLRRQIGENARGRAARNIMQSLGLRWAEVLEGKAS